MYVCTICSTSFDDGIYSKYCGFEFCGVSKLNYQNARNLIKLINFQDCTVQLQALIRVLQNFKRIERNHIINQEAEREGSGCGSCWIFFAIVAFFVCLAVSRNSQKQY